VPKNTNGGKFNAFIDLTPIQKKKKTVLNNSLVNKSYSRRSQSIKDKPNNININIQNTPYKVLEINCKKGQEKIILSNFPLINK
jgi:hypothetical protein